MVRPINTDIFSLQRKAEKAAMADLPVVQDLLDTLAANAYRCVGMAANMIGVNKRIIVILLGGIPVAILNPEILKKEGVPYDTEEGCLSLTGTRPTRRYPTITVRYQDKSFKTHTQVFTGYTAQIIQHEVDHCEGILI